VGMADGDGGAAGAAAGPPPPQFLVGIDPGSVKCGGAVIDAVTGECVRLFCVPFRASGTGGDDIGFRRLLISLDRWITSELELFTNSFVFIEEQPPEAQREIIAVQYGFQMRLGGRCKAVSAAAYKAKFAEYFPRHPNFSNFETHRQKPNQKAFDRSNAIKAGQELVPAAVNAAYLDATHGQMFDDAYEALFAAKYGRVALLADDGRSILSTPRAAARRTVADGPHKRWRVEVTKAEARRALRAKAKVAAAEAKAAAKASGAAKPKATPKPRAKAWPKPKPKPKTCAVVADAGVAPESTRAQPKQRRLWNGGVPKQASPLTTLARAAASKRPLDDDDDDDDDDILSSTRHLPAKRPRET